MTAGAGPPGLQRPGWGVLTLAWILAMQAAQITAAEDAEAVRWYSPHHAAAGAVVYRRHCAQCHGVAGEGAPEWRKPDEEGLMPPPPLDGSGHAWHHPLRQLFAMIRDGSLPGQGRMPGWGAQLSGGEILAVIAWFQSAWPTEVYRAWSRMDAQHGAGRRISNSCGTAVRGARR